MEESDDILRSPILVPPCCAASSSPLLVAVAWVMSHGCIECRESLFIMKCWSAWPLLGLKATWKKKEKENGCMRDVEDGTEGIEKLVWEEVEDWIFYPGWAWEDMRYWNSSDIIPSVSLCLPFAHPLCLSLCPYILLSGSLYLFNLSVCLSVYLSIYISIDPSSIHSSHPLNIRPNNLPV